MVYFDQILNSLQKKTFAGEYIKFNWLHPFQNDNCLDSSDLKEFADDNSKVDNKIMERSFPAG